MLLRSVALLACLAAGADALRVQASAARQPAVRLTIIGSRCAAPIAPAQPVLRIATHYARAPAVQMQEVPFWENVVRFMRSAAGLAFRVAATSKPSVATLSAR